MDVVVVGGGSGGLTAARRLIALGARTTLINAGRLGGDCTWVGCVPSKALIHAAATGRSFDEAMASVHAAIRRIAASEDAATLEREGITVLEGRGRIVAADRVELDDGHTVRADRIILATGSRPALPDVPGLAEVDPLTNETVFELGTQPASLAILGGGAIGCELAQAFARLGTRVTIVEPLERLLSREEPEASEAIVRALQRDGVDVRVGVPVASVRRASSGTVDLLFADRSIAQAERVLVATGRVPLSSGLGLDEVGVACDGHGNVTTDETLATSLPTVFAIGDVTGKLPFTHAAGRMAWIASHNAVQAGRGRRPQRFSTRATPWATFTAPEVGRVGLTEEEAAAVHSAVRVAHLPLDELDRAVITGCTDGFVKLIAGPRRGLRHVGGGVLLGATVVAPTGGEMIHEAALAMQTRMFVGRLAQTTHAYPTWAMAMQLAALRFFEREGSRRGWRRARG